MNFKGHVICEFGRDDIGIGWRENRLILAALAAPQPEPLKPFLHTPNALIALVFETRESLTRLACRPDEKSQTGVDC